MTRIGSRPTGRRVRPRIISGRTGRDSERFTIIARAASTLGKYAPSIPTRTPMEMARSDAAMPTVIEIRVPQTTSAKMSRPRLSVPNQCALDGGWRTSALNPLG